MNTNYTSKEINNKIFSFQKINEKEIIISCDSVHHIPGRNIVELYLILQGVKSIVWKDAKKEITSIGLFKNIGNLFLEFLLFPFNFLKFIWINSQIPNKVKHIPFPSDPKIVYLRTDHWFNLSSGGSVGHVSGVVNELHKLHYLTQLITTDSLYEVQAQIPQKIISPNYFTVSNIPDFPALVYNHIFKEILDDESAASANMIYQRLSLGNFLGILLKYKKNIPLIIEYNGSEIWASEKWGGRKLKFATYYKKIEEANLQHADLIVVVSAPLKEELILRGILANKILVNPNGVNIEKFNSKINGDNIRLQYHLNDKKVFGFIGTFAEWHGVIFMVESIVSFFKKHPTYLNSVRFFLIGSGNLLNKSKQIIKENNLEAQVIFTDRIDQSLSPLYLAACDSFLSPHIPNPDGSKFFGSPTKLFEYMAMRKPIIASDLDQIGEILKTHHAALLIEPGNTNAFIDALQKIIEEPILAATLADNAYNAVIDSYTWEKHVLHILASTKK